MANICSVTYIHAPSFFALLEQGRDMELTGKPVVVTRVSGNAEFIVSASLEARLQGVSEGMTARHAGRYSPEAVFIPADWDFYRDASRKLLDVLSIYSPLLEPHGLDGAYMDLSGCTHLFGTPREIANRIREKIKTEVGVPVSVGIASNKFVARVAASRCRPGRTLFIPVGREAEFLSPLPTRLLPGIGEKIEKQLLNLGVMTIGDLTSVPENLLGKQFGIMGRRLYDFSRGIDNAHVQALYPPDRVSVHHSHDFMDGDLLHEEALSSLPPMCEAISDALRRRNRRAGKVILDLQFMNHECAVAEYQPKLPVSSPVEILFSAKRLFLAQVRDLEISSISLTVCDLQEARGVQLSIFGDDERRRRLDGVLSTVTQRFGEKSLITASTLLKAG